MTDLAARLRATGIAECAEYGADTAYLVGGRHKVAADACITRLLDEVDAAMSLVTAATREGVLAEALEHAEQAEAEVALRDRMLRDIIERIALTPERWNGWTTEEVLTDLRARAEKEAER